MPLHVIPLDLGYVTDVQCAAHKYFQGFGDTLNAQMIVWLIKGGPYPVVVDFGPGDPETVVERFGRVYVREPHQVLRRALEREGVSGDDVGAVVLTHLHWDHSQGWETDPFPNARVYVQREEMRYAASPYPPHQGLFEPTLLRRLLPTHASLIDNVEIIDGDFALFDGVTILHAPGHTPGSQAVLVDTGEVTYVLAGDNVPFSDMWQGRTQGTWIPSGTHVTLTDVYASLNRYALLADVVLPSHDAEVLTWGPFPAGGPTFRDPPGSVSRPSTEGR